MDIRCPRDRRGGSISRPRVGVGAWVHGLITERPEPDGRNVQRPDLHNRQRRLHADDDPSCGCWTSPPHKQRQWDEYVACAWWLASSRRFAGLRTHNHVTTDVRRETSGWADRGCGAGTSNPAGPTGLSQMNRELYSKSRKIAAIRAKRLQSDIATCGVSDITPEGVRR
jgi:hypothetical protein